MSTIGEYILLFKVFVQTDSTSVILILMSLAVVPAVLKCICTFWQNRQKTIRRSFIFKLLPILPLILQISGMIYFVYLFSKIYTSASKDSQYLLPIAVLLKSLVFWENFWTLKRSKTGSDKPESPKALDNSDTKTNDTESVNSADNEGDHEKLREDDKYKIICKTAVRVVLTTAFIIVIKTNNGSFPFLTDASSSGLAVHGKYHIENMIPNYNQFVRSKRELTYNSSVAVVQTNKTISTVNSTEIGASVEELLKQEESKEKKNTSMGDWFLDVYKKHYLAIVLLVISFIFPYFSGLACRLQMQRFSFSLPLVIIPVLTWILVYLACVNDEVENVFRVLHLSVTCLRDNRDLFIYQRVGIAVALWIALWLLTWYIWKPDVERMAKLGT